MANRLKDLWLRAIGLVDAGANQESKVVLTKRDDTHQKNYASVEDCLKDKDEATCKELMAAMKAGTQTVGTGQTVVLDLTKVEETMPDPKVTEELAKVQTEAADLKKRLDAAEAKAKDADERVAKMEDERLRGVFIAKAQEFKNLPGANPDDFGPILRKGYAVWSPEEQVKVETILRGAVKVAEDSALFQELGAGPGSAGGDAYAKLTAKANALIEKSANPLTFEQAFAKVSETPEGRKLLQDYEKERGEATARRVR